MYIVPHTKNIFSIISYYSNKGIVIFEISVKEKKIVTKFAKFWTTFRNDNSVQDFSWQLTNIKDIPILNTELAIHPSPFDVVNQVHCKAIHGVFLANSANILYDLV